LFYKALVESTFGPGKLSFYYWLWKLCFTKSLWEKCDAGICEAKACWKQNENQQI